MKAFLQVEVKHSGKKDTDYISSAIHVGKRSYFVNLSQELISILLDCKVSELESLPQGYKSKEFEINL